MNAKRIFDIVVSCLGLVILSPLLVFLAVIIRIKLGRPVLFSQTRPGLNEKQFRIYKFRTMTNARDEFGKLLPDDQRLTRFGRMLRRTSLDELPELFNILKGEMSLVGPRPLLPEYLPYYNDRERRRHFVRPGLTGLAQINGRNLLMWDERLELDVQYVESMSMWNDLKIIIKTVQKVVSSEDVVDPGSVEPHFSTYRSKVTKADTIFTS